MPALSAASFPQFYQAMRSKTMTNKQVVQYLSQRTKYVIAEMIKGQDPSNITGIGGTSFTDVVKLGTIGTGGSYSPGDFATPVIGSNNATINIPIAHYRSHVGWTDAEYNLSTRGGEEAQVKSFAKLKDQDGKVEQLELLDNLCFARPDSATMEAANIPAGVNRAAMSIPAWISEDTVRLRPPATAWALNTIATLDVSLPQNASWRNRVATYNPASWDDPFTGILPAMDQLGVLLDYHDLRDVGDAIQGDSGNMICIYTNLDGFVKLQGLARAMQDSWLSNDDGQRNRPTWGGRPVIHAPQLETELLEQTVGAGAAYSGTPYAVNRPRFYWVNKKFLRPKFMDGGFLAPEKPARNMVNQPDSTIVWRQTSMNICCSNRTRHGIVAPAA